MRNFILLLIACLSSTCFGIDKGDLADVSKVSKDKIFQCFDGKGYYLVDDHGKILANRWGQTSRIEAPPAFTATINMYVIVFLKHESAQSYVDYYYKAYGQKHTIKETDLPPLLDKVFNAQTSKVLEPDIVITESPKIPPIQPEYFADPKTQKPYTIEVNGHSFIPCFLLKDEADAFLAKITKQTGKTYIPVIKSFKDFLKFVDDELELGNQVRVFGSPSETLLKKYMDFLQSDKSNSENAAPDKS